MSIIKSEKEVQGCNEKKAQDYKSGGWGSIPHQEFFFSFSRVQFTTYWIQEIRI